MSVVRPFHPEDALGVAELFQKMLLRPSQPALAPLAAYLVEVFLHHPWFDPEFARTSTWLPMERSAASSAWSRSASPSGGSPSAPPLRDRTWWMVMPRILWRERGYCARSSRDLKT